MNITVPNTVQFADFEALVLEQPPNLAVAPLVQADAQPGVAALAGFGGDVVEARGPVVELDAGPEPVEHGLRRRAPQPHAVLALDLARRVHEPMRELAVVREQQEPRGVHVEPADDDPASAA